MYGEFLDLKHDLIVFDAAHVTMALCAFATFVLFARALWIRPETFSKSWAMYPLMTLLAAECLSHAAQAAVATMGGAGHVYALSAMCVDAFMCVVTTVAAFVMVRQLMREPTHVELKKATETMAATLGKAVQEGTLRE